MKIKKILKKIIPLFFLEFYWNYKLKKKKYFSRNKIDKEIIKFLDYRNGFFIEIGANDGIKQSNTYFLESIFDAKGILIEASASNFEKLIINRSKKNTYDSTTIKSSVARKNNH